MPEGSIPCYTAGEEANEVLASTNISEEERKNFETVIAKLDEYFKVRNIIFKRACFNRRNQLPGESADTYIAELYCLVEHCRVREF